MKKMTKRFIIILAVTLCRMGAGVVLAQDPVVWQQSARGLSVDQNDGRRTAGLGFIIRAQDWPLLSLRGGVSGADISLGHLPEAEPDRLN